MRRKIAPIVLFVTMQAASVAVLTLWIVWSALDSSHIGWLLQGIFLMAAVITASAIIFAYWGKLRALEVERINFLSTVSHELLTPLASLKLYLETMEMHQVSREQELKFLADMSKDTARLEELIQQILVSSRIERHKNNYHFRPHSLKELTQKYLAENSRELGEAEVKTELLAPAWALVDEEAFHTVLRNLLLNSVRYSLKPANITIRLDEVSGHILLEVIDKGQGIPQKELKKVFRLFYRAAKNVGGTGLGLFIVKNIIKDHHGRVWAESSGLGKGTTMKILLPTCASPAAISNSASAIGLSL